MKDTDFAGDPAFETFASATWQYLADIRPDPVHGTMPPADRLREVLAGLRKAQSDGGAAETSDPRAFREYVRLTGLSEDETTRRIADIHATARGLAERHPETGEMETGDRARAFLRGLAAFAPFVRSLSEHLGAPAGPLALAIAGENPDDTGLGCEDLCLIEFGVDIAKAVAELMALLAICAALVFPPAALICAGIAFILYFLATTDAQRDYKNCIEDCGGG